MQKTKKQHYVPRCYLKAFTVPDSFQMNVYDKKMRQSRINNYEDVASENYFYDFALSDEEYSILAEVLESSGQSIDVQYIEHLFANDIEPVFSERLEGLKTAANNYTPWFVENCQFFRKSQKEDFSFLLAFQLIRTKGARNSIANMVDCFQQAFGVHELASRKVNVDFFDVNIKHTHSQMFMNMETILQLSCSFLKLKWFLCINQTTTPIITSDNPIVTIPHIWNGSTSMGGVGSKGVEIAFPVAPNAVLVMIDGEYHHLPIHDLAFVPMDDESVEHYNTMQVVHADRCLFSSTQDFSVVDRVLAKHPDLFDMPTMSLSWKNKKFFPRRK